MSLNDFFQKCEKKSSHLFREFIWILTEKFSLNEAKLVSGEQNLSENHIKTLEDWVVRKEEDYPLQYFLGSSDFMGLDLFVSDGVLIPRGETEEIGFWVLNQLKDKEVCHLMDIGAGSGCLGIGVACSLKSLESLVLIEPFGDESLQKNIEKHCTDKHFSTHKVEETFESYEFNKKFDVILSNPPYIRYNDPDVASGVYAHEPHNALFGGELGWEKEVLWAQKAFANLNPGGLLVFEISHDQREVLVEKLKGCQPKIHKDQFGRDRFMSIEKGA